MPVERRDPAVCNDSNKKGGKGEMTKAPICLQDLRRSLYVKAKAEPTWRFWGLYVHVCKMETLHEAYQMAKKNDGAPGIDGVTFDAIEEGGVESLWRGCPKLNTFGGIMARVIIYLAIDCQLLP
jgi:hypothetical protein